MTRGVDIPPLFETPAVLSVQKVYVPVEDTVGDNACREYHVVRTPGLE